VVGAIPIMDKCISDIYTIGSHSAYQKNKETLKSNDMNYTEKEVEVIKQRAYDNGKRKGILFTIILMIIFVIITIMI
jgi:hypothetical protein